MTDEELFARYSLAFDPFVGLDVPAVSPVDVAASLFDPYNLPHIAGGQVPVPGIDWGRILLRLFGSAGSVGELADWLEDRVNELADLIWGGIGGTIRFTVNHVTGVGWMVSAFVFNQVRFFSGLLADGQQWVRDQVVDVVTFVGAALAAGQQWVRNQVVDVVTFVGTGLAAGQQWVRDQVADVVTFIGTLLADGQQWVRDQVTDVVVFIGQGILNGLDWLWERVSDVVVFIGQGILDGLDWLADHVTSVVVAGGEAVIGAIGDIGNAIVDRLIGPIVETAQLKLGIPGKLLRGDYASAEEFTDDLTDPVPLVLAGLVGVIIIPLLISQLVTMAAGPVVQELWAPAVQRTAAKVGAGLPTTGDILEAWNRALIDPGTARTWLGRQGLGGQPIDVYEQLRLRMPGPTDLVRFGVREVFTPEIAERFGQFDDFPAQFGSLMEFLGYGGGASGPGAVGGPGGGRTWAEAFWAAHWDLPSPNQAFEMLHRRVSLDDGSTFDIETLRLLLRALDVMPFWRGPLTQIAFRPFTRVDVRRMHLIGILDEREVTNAYLDLGFDPEKAQAMTQFTIRYNAPDDETELDRRRDLAASQVRLAYRRHIISRDDAIDKLVELRYVEDDAHFLLSLDDVTLALNPTNDADVDVRDLTTSVILRAYRDRLWTFEQAFDELQVLGYTNTSADLMLALEDHKVEQGLTEIDISAIREDLRARNIDIERAGVRLNGLDIEPRRRDLLLVRWTRENRVKTRPLTRAQIVNAHQVDIFTAEEAMQELGVVGYSERNAGILLELSRPEPTPEKARELSAGAVAGAFRQGLFTPDEAMDRLVTLGFAEVDAGIILQLQDRELTAGSIERAYRKGVIARDDALSRIVALGFSPEDAATRVEVVDTVIAAAEAPRELAASALLRALREGVLTRDDVAIRIRALGFTAEDTEILIRTEEAKGAES